MIKKIFLALLALCFIFIGSCSLLFGYLFFNPGVVGSGFEWVANRSLKTTPYEQKEEYYIQGISQIKITSTEVPIKVEIYDGPSLQVEITGQVQGDVTSLILSRAENEILQLKLLEPESNSGFHLNINGQQYSSRDELKATAVLYVPRDYKNKVLIQTTVAPVDVFLPPEYFAQLELRSESGQVQNKWEPAPLKNQTEVKGAVFEITTQQGSISIQDRNL